MNIKEIVLKPNHIRSLNFFRIMILLLSFQEQSDFNYQIQGDIYSLFA